MLQAKVETQNFASHKEVCACCQHIFACVCWCRAGRETQGCVCLPAYFRVRMLVWGGRETQGCVCLPVYFRVCMLVWAGRETQGCVCLPAYFRVRMLVWGGRETQDFASLLLGLHNKTVVKIDCRCCVCCLWNVSCHRYSAKSVSLMSPFLVSVSWNAKAARSEPGQCPFVAMRWYSRSSGR